jgi:hypothetical protein
VLVSLRTTQLSVIHDNVVVSQHKLGLEFAPVFSAT